MKCIRINLIALSTHLLLLLSLFILPLNSGNVNAYVIGGKEFSLPSGAQFGNNNGSNYTITSFPTYNDGYQAVTNGSISVSNAGGGASICFNAPNALIAGHTYNLVVHLMSSNTNSISVVDINNYTFVRAGYYVADAMSRPGSLAIQYFNSSNYNWETYNTYLLNYLVVPNLNYTSLCLPFTTNPASNASFTFYGINIEDAGNNLTSSEIQSIITNTQNYINNAIINSTNTIYSNINSAEQSINNNLNNAKNEINNNINELGDDITEADSDAYGSFFDDFDDPMPSSVTSVLTAPLTFISTIDDACRPVTLDVLGSDFTIPCGDEIFWNKESVSSFRSIWNILFGGSVCYMLLLKLFKLYEQLLDPVSNVTITDFKGVD